MIGGAMIAEGGFGCVFHPAIPCSNDKEEETIASAKINYFEGYLWYPPKARSAVWRLRQLGLEIT